MDRDHSHLLYRYNPETHEVETINTKQGYATLSPEALEAWKLAHPDEASSGPPAGGTMPATKLGSLSSR